MVITIPRKTKMAHKMLKTAPNRNFISQLLTNPKSVWSTPSQEAPLPKMTEIFEQFPYNNTGFKYKFCGSYIWKTLLLVHEYQNRFGHLCC